MWEKAIIWQEYIVLIWPLSHVREVGGLFQIDVQCKNSVRVVLTQQLGIYRHNWYKYFGNLRLWDIPDLQIKTIWFGMYFFFFWKCRSEFQEKLEILSISVCGLGCTEFLCCLWGQKTCKYAYIYMSNLDYMTLQNQFASPNVTYWGEKNSDPFYFYC